MRVKIIVLNSVLHDARVIKEANTLAAAGHDVSIIGLFDKRSTDTDVHLPSGVHVRLCKPLLSDATQQVFWYARLAACVAILLLGILTLQLLAGSSIGTELRPVVSNPYVWKPALVACLLAIFVGVTSTLSRRTKARAQGPIEQPNQTGASSVTSDAFIDKLECRCKRITRPVRDTSKRVVRLLIKAPFRFIKNKLGARFKSLVRPIARPLYKKMRQQHIVAAALEGGLDVVHCHDIWSLPSGAAIRKKTGVPLIWDAHEIYEEVAQGDRRHAAHCRKLMKRYESQIDYFITINESIASFYKSHYPQLPSATVVKNATVYTPGVGYDGRLHKAAGLPSTQKIALYQGGFAEKRGLRTLVEAARYLHQDWTLVMMGWGTLEHELKALRDVPQLGTAARNTPHVVFLPAVPQSELIYWTAGGTVGLIPYENVGLNHLYCTPNKLWEYPAATVPILCSPLVEMTKTVRQHGTGWLLPDPAGPKEIAESINSLTSSQIDTARRCCKDFITADNWSVYGIRLTELYAEIALSLEKTVTVSTTSH